MLNLPDPPATLVTRSLHCVSCREQFTVSQQNPVAGQRAGSWRIMPDHYPDIPLRYQPNSHRRPIFPETRAAPEETVEEYAVGPAEIICPRCGADNRNWLRITTDSTPWHQRFRLAGIAIPLAIIYTLIIATLFFTDPLILDNVAWPLRLATIIFILASGLLTSWLPTQDWTAVRDNLNKSRYLPGNKRPFIPTKTLILALILIAGIPAIFFAAIPKLIEITPDLISPPANRNTVGRISSLLDTLTPAQIDQASDGQRANLLAAAYGMQTAVNAKQTACNTLPVQDAITTLDNLQNETVAQRQQIIPQIIRRLNDYSLSETTAYCRTELLESAVAQLIRLETIERSGSTGDSCTQSGNTQACYAEIIRTLILQLEQMLPNDTFPENLSLHEQLLLSLQNARSFQLNTPDSATETMIKEQLLLLEAFVKREADVITISKVFFINWFVFVGIAAAVGTLFGYLATEEYAKRANRQLPAPIYATVANMTRVVIWEARRALEIRRNLNEIQWLQAIRNPDGGITLIGLERDTPDYDNQTNNLSDKVRAQKYHIVSDLLGHIESVTVQDVLVKRSLAGPGYAFPGWEQAIPATPARGNIIIERD